jgi:hypothetical protein
MKRKHCFLRFTCFVFFLLGLPGGLLAAQEAVKSNASVNGQVSLEDIPDGQLDQAQMQKLFANRTAKGIVFKGTKDRKDFTFTRYFRADGVLFEKSTKDKNKPDRSGSWSVYEEALCINWQNQNKFCHRIVKEKNVINEYKVKKSGQRILIATYNQFWDGELEPGK